MSMSSHKLRTTACFFAFFFLILTSAVSEQYRIRSVVYEITGITRKYPLSQAVKIDTNRIFNNRAEFEAYLQDKLVQLKNQRILEEAYIFPSYGEENETGIIPVDLLIKTKDTWNIIGLPYPKYNSNTGFVFKLKIKDYNFFGTMRTLNGELSYEYKMEEGKASKHKIGGGISFDIPFKFRSLHSNWENSLNLNYTIGEKAPAFDFTTGVGFSLPIHKLMSLNFGVSQAIKYNPDYQIYGDALYLTESTYVNFPITLAKMEKWGDIVWVPAASLSWNWDPTDITTRWDGISYTDLKGPDITIGHSLSMGRVDWIHNYRRGYSANMSQSLSYDIYSSTYSTSFSVSGEYYRAFKYAGFASRLYVFKNFGSKSEEGSRIRGIRDAYIKTDSALLLNIDVPIKVLQTDWVGWGAPSWMIWLDFEMQLSPFIDIALGNNEAAHRNYNPKDGWYAAGLEIIGFPNKMRSIQGRISFGVDTVRFAQEAGKYIRSIDTAVKKIFTTDWRKEEWYELSIGIGLHY